jgi:hypothetical protein
MDQIPSWEADSLSVIQEMNRLLWNSKVHHPVRWDFVLSHEDTTSEMNISNMPEYWLTCIHVNIW